MGETARAARGVLGRKVPENRPFDARRGGAGPDRRE